MNFNKNQYKISLLVLIVIAILVIYTSGITNFLTFQNLVDQSQNLQNFVNQNWLISTIAFVLIYILVVTFSLPGAAIMTLAGGYLFGFLGIPLSVTGATIGASANFVISRYLVGNAVQQKYSAQLKKFNDQFSKDGVSYLLTLRFLPVFPFFIVNLLSGLTKVKFSTFILTTVVGIIPGTSVYNFAGQSLLDLKSPSDVLSPNIILALSILGAFTLFPTIIKKFKKSTT
jgi:uncharacterized membrane protein YdjX (TVP38/TMEM64 family)